MKHFVNSNLRFFSDLISTSAVKNHRLSLLLLMLFTLLLLPANMVAQTAETAYAVLDGSGTLTFKYGDKSAESFCYELNQVGNNIPGWVKENPGAITKVVFDESFKHARPTTCFKWFQNCSNLESIEKLQYLNTSEVKDMGYMFNGCSKLASLDLSKFNTEKVQHMKYMFADCLNLTKLDLSNFNTWRVTNMNYMFARCYKLETIYSDHFNLSSDPSSFFMFNNCKLLKGAIGYDSNIKDANGANYKTGYFTKLVGKNGSEKIGATGSPLIVENLTLTDDKDFVAYNEPFRVKVASYIRTMKEGTTWGTLCLPFEVSLEGQNFRAFTLRSVTEDAIELEEITSYINAGYPVIIKMNDGKTNLNFTVEKNDIAITPQDTYEKYQLQGLYTQKEFSKDADNNCYIVKGNKLMNPGKLLENKKVTKVVSKPFRAYMVDNSPAPATGAKMFSIGISDSATAIDTLNAIANDKAEYFDLQGHRLNEPQKGINIVKRGNKTMKVIIK